MVNTTHFCNSAHVPGKAFTIPPSVLPMAGNRLVLLEDQATVLIAKINDPAASSISMFNLVERRHVRDIPLPENMDGIRWMIPGPYAMSALFSSLSGKMGVYRIDTHSLSMMQGDMRDYAGMLVEQTAQGKRVLTCSDGPVAVLVPSDDALGLYKAAGLDGTPGRPYRFLAAAEDIVVAATPDGRIDIFDFN